MSETERVTLVGNLTADPELRYTPSGLEVANLRMAVTPRTRQDDGSWTQGETNFHTVIVWRDQATNTAEILTKGGPGDRGRPAQAAQLDRPRRHHPRGHRDRRRGGRPVAALGHRHPHSHQRPQGQLIAGLAGTGSGRGARTLRASRTRPLPQPPQGGGT